MMESTDPGYSPKDDLRHWPAPGGRMRDSLFWELMTPDERLGLQIYLYLTDRGNTGYNVSVWGPGTEPVALQLAAGTVGDDMDLDDFHFKGLSIKQPELGRVSEVSYRSAEVNVDLNFTALHDAFSYRSKPGGLPEWFAVNRVEQTGRVVNGWIWIARGKGFAGYVLRGGKPVAVSHIDHRAAYHDMRQRRLEAEIVDVDGQVTWLELDCFDVVKLPTKDPMGTVIYEGACEAPIDGEKGAGQFGTHWHGSYLVHLTGSRT